MNTPPERPGAIATRRPKPWGAYRRAVRITANGPDVCAQMEDDVHHFALNLRHRDGIVTEVTGQAIRTPWSICPGALDMLGQLQGRTLGDVATLASAARAEHCMHMFDLVLLAVRNAGKDGFVRHYRIEGNYDQSPPLMQMWRDDLPTLAWSVHSGKIVGSQFDGVALNALAQWLTQLPADDAEAALILRRATLIAAVRTLELDRYDSADDLNPNAPAVCFARQPQKSALAMRNVGSARDFHGTGTWPLVPPAQ